MTAVAPKIDLHVSIHGAARLLGVSRYKVLSLVTSGMIESVMVAGHACFLRADVEALRDQLTAERQQGRRARRKAAR
jgi:excisionase family DNA binding protein